MTLLANALVDGAIHVRDCAWCGQGFYQGSKRQRFCSLKCGEEFFKAERRAALALYRSIKDEDDDEPETRAIAS
jgi:predicted  nucleic acid-binding Zn-ribbon protein